MGFFLSSLQLTQKIPFFLANGMLHVLALRFFFFFLWCRVEKYAFIVCISYFNILYTKCWVHVCQKQIFHALLLQAIYLGLIEQGCKRSRIRWLLRLWAPADHPCINRKSSKKLTAHLFFPHDTWTYFFLDWKRPEFRLDCSSEVSLFLLIWVAGEKYLTNQIFLDIFSSFSCPFSFLTFHIYSFRSHPVTLQSDRSTWKNIQRKSNY